MSERCPNPYCDGYGWITVDAAGTSNAYRVPACRVGPHLKLTLAAHPLESHTNAEKEG